MYQMLGTDTFVHSDQKFGRIPYCSNRETQSVSQFNVFGRHEACSRLRPSCIFLRENCLLCVHTGDATGRGRLNGSVFYINCGYPQALSCDSPQCKQIAHSQRLSIILVNINMMLIVSFTLDVAQHWPFTVTKTHFEAIGRYFQL